MKVINEKLVETRLESFVKGLFPLMGIAACLLVSACASQSAKLGVRDTAAEVLAPIKARSVKVNVNPGCGCPSKQPIFNDGMCYVSREAACSEKKACKTYSCQ